MNGTGTYMIYVCSAINKRKLPEQIFDISAEATWAMITVIVVIIVVVIFCCFVPFWRALKKRDHHWEDPENDPRWDLDNFQFSTTSPRPERKLGDDNGDYNRLSVVSNNNSSTHTSNSAVNNNFRNNYLLPRSNIDALWVLFINFITDSLTKSSSSFRQNTMMASHEARLMTAVRTPMIINQQ